MRLHKLFVGPPRVVVGTLVLASALVVVGSREGAAQGKVEIESDMSLAVAFSQLGTAVASAGLGGKVKLWDPRTGELRHTIQGPNRTIWRALTFSPDGITLAVGGDDRAIHLWDVRTGEHKQTFADHLGSLMAISFSPDGRTLAAAAIQHEVQAGIATGNTTAEVRLWDVRLGKCKRTWRVPEGKVYSLAFSPDGKSLASAEGPVQIRDVATGNLKSSFTPQRGSVFAVAFSPDGKELAGAGGYSVNVGATSTRSVGEVHIWEISSKKLRLTLTDLESALCCLAISPDGRVLAAGGSGPIKQQRGTSWISSELQLRDARTGELLRAVEGKLGNTHSLAFSPDGETIIWCDNKEVLLSETSTGLRRTTLMTVTERLLGK